MLTQANENNTEEDIQFSCFYLGETLCGLDVRLIQEINDDLVTTHVPLSPGFVVGIMNLRGQIITVIDQSLKIGLGKSTLKEQSRIIIVKFKEQFVGLLVDSMAEVLTVSKNKISNPPSNLKDIKGRFFYGVVRTNENELIGLLDLQVLLRDEQNQINKEIIK